MTFTRAAFLCFAAALLTHAACEEVQPFELKVRLLHATVATRFPLVFVCDIRNVSGNALKLHSLADKEELYFKVTCEERGFVREKQRKSLIELAVNGAGSYMSFKPGEEKVFWIVPENTYFDRAGTYSLKYSASISYVKTDDKTIEQKWTGAIGVDVNEQLNSSAQMELIVSQLDGTSRRSVEVAKALAIISDTSTIRPLLKIARESPMTGPIVGVAFEKFASQDAGREALEKLAEEFPPNELIVVDGAFVAKEQEYGYTMLAAALAAFQKSNVVPSKEFIHRNLRSYSNRKIGRMLSYLLASGAHKAVDLKELKRLESNEDKGVRELARKVLEKVPVNDDGPDF